MVDTQAHKTALAVVAAAALIITARLYSLITFARPAKKMRTDKETCRVAVFLGSGGHTAEMMQLLQALPNDRYNFRTYIVTSNDRFSIDKAQAYEKQLQSQSSTTSSSPTHNVIKLPRARYVHQKWMSTPATVFLAFGACIYHLVLLPLLSTSGEHVMPDVMLMNGPGTCVPIVASIYVLRIFGLPSPRLIYIESFARVSSLSLTGKILSRFVDRFLVQWQQGLVRGAEYRGIMV